jgi:hypothetical protein
VFAVCGREPLIDIAVALERAALADPYFVERKLYPNVDFYSGLIYKGTRYFTLTEREREREREAAKGRHTYHKPSFL